MFASTSDAALEAGHRLRIVAVVRLVVTATLAAVFATFGRDLVDPGSLALLGTAAAVHVGVNAIVLLVPSHRLILDLSVVVDAAVLAVALAVTGGPLSPLTVLVVVPVAALTLAFGVRAGVRTGAAFTTAMIWVLMTVVGGTPPEVTGVPRLAADPTIRTVALVAGIWLVVAVTSLMVRVTERQLRQTADDLERLHDLVTSLDPRRGMEDVAAQLTGAVVAELAYAAASLWLPTDSGLEFAAGAGCRPDDARDDAALRIDAADDTDVSADADGLRLVSRTDPRPDALGAVHGDRAPLVLLTLRVDGEPPVGMLAVQVPARRDRARIRGRDLRVLRRLAAETAPLLETARMEAELRLQALIDELTGLANRRFLDQRLPEEIERAARRAEAGHPSVLSFALIDIDHFKSVNDRYGHPVGDRTLRAVADAARATVRTSNVVCRYGGEEFGVILVDTDQPEAVLACERLRRAIAEVTITTDAGTTIGVTASFGIATRTAASSFDAAELIAAADEALYTAKRTGRNRVVHRETEATEVVDIADAPTTTPDITLP